MQPEENPVDNIEEMQLFPPRPIFVADMSQDVRRMLSLPTTTFRPQPMNQVICASVSSPQSPILGRSASESALEAFSSSAPTRAREEAKNS